MERKSIEQINEEISKLDTYTMWNITTFVCPKCKYVISKEEFKLVDLFIKVCEEHIEKCFGN